MDSFYYTTKIFSPDEILWLDDKAECFLLQPGGRVTSILAGEEADAPEGDDFLWLYLLRGTRADGLVGVSDIQLAGGQTVGGWCTFHYEMRIPRRFAIRAGRALLEGQSVDDIVRLQVRSALRTLLSTAEAARNSAATLSLKLQELVGDLLEEMGLQLTDCRLEQTIIAAR